MSDIIERLGRSQIQHGENNNRIYLMKLDPRDSVELVGKLDNLAQNNGYTKIFAKVPAEAQPIFTEAGYQVEAHIPQFFNGTKDAAFLGKYFCDKRKKEKKPEMVREIIETARSKAGQPACPELKPGFELRRLEHADAESMAEVYRQVFASYPFPIHDPDYLRETMDDNILYWGTWEGNKLAAISSAETYPDERNAEMTDFATLPDYRGAGLAQVLLAEMEEELRRQKYHTAYTIARAYSFGMNITFAKHGYSYSGTLTHNTDISGELESMNIWHKAL
ncbi:MAG: putative beta-lysine N-acetyltransferase [Geoalkalibacter sp.]|uniref:putative beta-lysine N-acetyltransferase n=1 Tax=Geoalkalibacter sp. TaxID=3041440 RepID=UPI003D10460E